MLAWGCPRPEEGRILEISAILEQYDLCERREAAFPYYKREQTDKTTRMISLGGADSMISWSALSSDDADEAIEGELGFFKALGSPFEWKLYSHDRPGDLKARLAARGFSIGEDEAIMALDLEELPEALLAQSPHDLRRVSDDRVFADFVELNTKAWPEDRHSEARFETIRKTLFEAGDRMSAYVAYVDGLPVCAARVDFPSASPFASLWGAATLEPFRRRGIYSAILGIRAREAIARGYRFLTIDASPMSRPIVARHGFRLLAISNPCDSPGPA